MKSGSSAIKVIGWNDDQRPGTVCRRVYNSYRLERIDGVPNWLTCNGTWAIVRKGFGISDAGCVWRGPASVRAASHQSASASR